MNSFNRKFWWYSLAIPRKLRAIQYRYFPPSRSTLFIPEPITADQLQPVFQDPYFTYAYYAGNNDFAQSMNLKPGLRLQDLKVQLGEHFNPILIALDALVSYNQFSATKSKGAQQRFLETGDFLAQCAVWKERAAWFLYQMPYPKYGMESPWVSGLTQALMLSVLLRQKVTDQRLLDGVFHSLWVPMEEGGVFTRHPSNYPWIAEYPSTKIPYVLNGQLSVIISLLEYLAQHPDEKLRLTLTAMINGFFSDYPAHVFGSDIRYCRTRTQLASIHYQGLHAFQLVHLYQLTRLEQVRALAEEWIPKVSWPDFARFHFLPDAKRLLHTLEAGLEMPSTPRQTAS